MNPAAIARLSTLYDEVADLSAAELEARLVALAGDDAALLPSLRRMLAARAAPETDDLLARGPAFTAPAAEAAAFAEGDAVGPWRLLRRLGEGGMGEVWLAERAEGPLRRSVALKLPTLGLRRQLLVQRFARERDILAALQHPNIARLYDAGEAADGQPWLALEFVDGVPITEHVRRAALDKRAVVRLMLQVLGAVQHAHANLVIHRDLKPGNVLVGAEGRAMLLDFGIAKLLQPDEGEAGETELTRVGGRALTPAYAAPEQLSGAPVSIATDLWALGVLLYELLCGERPFGGERQALERAILEAEPKPPHGLPPDLATVVLKALKKVPAERYATVAAFGEDLQRWLDGRPVRAQPDSRWYRTRKFVARNRLAVGAGGVVFVAVVAAAGVSLWQAGVAREQARLAQTEARTAQAVQDFLQGIFKASAADQEDPVKARQRTAKELLDEGAARIDKELDDAPRAKMRVLATLASIYDDLGETERTAEMQIRRAEFIDRRLPEDLAERAQAHADLTMTLSVIGRDAEAATHLKQATAIARRLPPTAADVRATIDMAETQYYAARNDPRGLDAARRLVAHRRQKAVDLGFVDSLCMEGELEVSAGLPAQALKTLDEAVAVAKTLPGGGDYAQIFARLGRAAARAATGQGAAAVDDAREALRLAAANTGESSSITVLTHGVLARVLTEQGQPAAALAAVLEGRRRLAAQPAMEAVGDIVSRLRLDEARVLRRLGRLEEALARFDEALTASLSGDSPLRVFWCAIGRAQVLSDQGRFDEAAAALDQARKLREQLDLQSWDQTLAWWQARASLALARGDTSGAQEAWSNLAADERLRAARGQFAVQAFEAEVALAVEGPARAGELARRALADDPTRIGRPNAAYDRSRLQRVLARALAAQGQLAEALTQLEDMLARQREITDPAWSPDRVAALREAAAILGRQGKTARAQAFSAEAEAIARRHRRLGPQFQTARPA